MLLFPCKNVTSKPWQFHHKGQLILDPGDVLQPNPPYRDHLYIQITGSSVTTFSLINMKPTLWCSILILPMRHSANIGEWRFEFECMFWIQQNLSIWTSCINIGVNIETWCPYGGSRKSLYEGLQTGLENYTCKMPVSIQDRKKLSYFTSL